MKYTCIYPEPSGVKCESNCCAHCSHEKTCEVKCAFLSHHKRGKPDCKYLSGGKGYEHSG